MRFPRSSGILMPVFSLPEGPGIGDLGPGAYRFVDFLQSAGQKIWQLLPLGPPARGDSPYSSLSAFAGNPLLISCDELVHMGLLTPEELFNAGHDTRNTTTVDYEKARSSKKPLLQAAFAKFRSSGSDELRRDFTEFCERCDVWLKDFARFNALATDLGNPDWSQWDPALVRREQSALDAVDERLAVEVEFAKFEQFVFASQWQKLKAYANQQNVQMYGDMPIFVAYESVDVWTNQELFCLDGMGRPLVVAGVPPDYFSETGQMWGNPLYNWDRLADSNYAWWTSRFRHAFEYFDILRIDHFRGFESFWEIPAGAENAIGGQWKHGPGRAPFDAAREALGELRIVAEDLGLITDAVHALRDALGFPGMRVLQFGVDSEDDPYHRPDSYPVHCFAYTGTHDNDTVLGWYLQRLKEGTDNSILSRYLGNAGDPVHSMLVRSVLNSAADSAIIPTQDLLGLDTIARINTPGLPEGNWMWRCAKESLSESLAADFRRWTEAANRI
jgi:4-alpha-glucanotransferase